MPEFKLFKVFSATDGVHTIYAVSKPMLERNMSYHLNGRHEIISETRGFTDKDIISLNKMALLKVKTGIEDKEVLEVLKRLLDDQLITEICNNGVYEKDKRIIVDWFNKA